MFKQIKFFRYYCRSAYLIMKYHTIKGVIILFLRFFCNNFYYFQLAQILTNYIWNTMLNFHFRVTIIRHLSCYTLLSVCRLPWPTRSCQYNRAPFFHVFWLIFAQLMIDLTLSSTLTALRPTCINIFNSNTNKKKNLFIECL